MQVKRLLLFCYIYYIKIHLNLGINEIKKLIIYYEESIIWSQIQMS